jgi:predicted XRE-type DNA-binding protein
VISDTNLRQEEWITNSPLSSEKFSNDIFESLCKNTNKKLVFELLKNPYFPQEYLSELADVQESYSNDELYLLWLILKHPNCPETVLKEISELDDSLDYKISLLKKAIALNPNAKKSIVQGLLKNVYRWVRQAAASHTSLNQKDIIELIEIAKSGVTELQKKNDEGDRYTLKGLLDNKNIDVEVKESLSSLLEDEDTYPKQFTKYNLPFNSDSHQRIAGGHMPLEVIASLLIEYGEDGFMDIASTLVGGWEDWSDYTDHYDSSGWDSGGGFLYITDSSVGLDEEEFEPDSYEIEKPLSKCMDKLEVGNFFMDVKSYDDYEECSFEEIIQEEELNIWECINEIYYELFDSNTIFGTPEYSVNESDCDRESALYVKDSKNGFTEVSLDVLYDEVHKKFGDELSEENVIKYLKNKYKK